jgi:predicted Zn-dependent peptidase
MAAESPDNQMIRLAQNEYYFGRSIPMQSVIDNLDAVTAADLASPGRRSLGRRQCRPDHAGAGC